MSYRLPPLGSPQCPEKEMGACSSTPYLHTGDISEEDGPSPVRNWLAPATVTRELHQCLWVGDGTECEDFWGVVEQAFGQIISLHVCNVRVLLLSYRFFWFHFDH